jgi:N-glycosylase/DNA lyase
MNTLTLKDDFSLKHTLECGQFFRYEKIDDWYYIVTHDALLKVKQKGTDLQYYCTPDKDQEFISRIFRLDDNLDQIVGTIIKDPLMIEAIDKYKGLRLMRQEPFECLISFICSANSSIPNIKTKLNKISELYGDYIRVDDFTFFTFPKPKDLASAEIDELENHKIGYHSKFVKESAAIVNNKSIDWERLTKLSYEEAKGELLYVFGGKGVGDKVADCVCLFALEKLDAFPIDVWIEKTMQDYYFGGKKISKEGISKFAREYFGTYAGYAQEYLYHYKRCSNRHSD